MTNNRMNNNRNDYETRTNIYYDDSSRSYERRADRRAEYTTDDTEITRGNPYRHTEEARAITRSKRRRQNILLSSAAIALVAAIAVGTMAFCGVFNTSKNPDPASASVSSQVDKGANKAAQPAKQSTKSTEAKQDAAPVQTTQSNNQQKTDAKTNAQSSQNKQQTNVQPQSNQTQSAQTQSNQTKSDNSTAQKSEDKIDTVNGERVYKDTKRQAPDKTGTPAHYYANGKTSYGFNWDYDTDNGNFVVKCDYNFNQQQYDFTFYGSTPGTAHVTLYYYTSDTNKVPVNLTVTVDNDLNVSVG